MPANYTIRSLYRNLLGDPANPVTMKLLADALDDAGYPEVSHAYRWAADRGRWPFRRLGKGPDGFVHFNQIDLRPRLVYDWNVILPDDNPLAGKVPEGAWLEKPLVLAIREWKERRYGGVHRAFIILAHALRSVHPSWL